MNVIRKSYFLIMRFRATSIWCDWSYVKKYKEVIGRLIERSLFDASVTRRINTSRSLWVERGDRIKNERYDSWRCTRSLPDLTQPDQNYSIGFDVFSRTRRKCAGRGRGKRYSSEAQLPFVAILWKRNSCPKDVPCFTLL